MKIDVKINCVIYKCDLIKNVKIKCDYTENVIILKMWKLIVIKLKLLILMWELSNDRDGKIADISYSHTK